MAYDEQLANRIRQAFGARKRHHRTQDVRWPRLPLPRPDVLRHRWTRSDGASPRRRIRCRHARATRPAHGLHGQAAQGDSCTSRRRASARPPRSGRGCLAASGSPKRRRRDRRSVARARSVLPPRATAARFDKSPVEQRSGLARFGRDDLFRDAPEIRSSDVRLRTERIPTGDVGAESPDGLARRSFFDRPGEHCGVREEVPLRIV